MGGSLRLTRYVILVGFVDGLMSVRTRGYSENVSLERIIGEKIEGNIERLRALKLCSMVVIFEMPFGVYQGSPENRIIAFTGFSCARLKISPDFHRAGYRATLKKLVLSLKEPRISPLYRAVSRAGSKNTARYPARKERARKPSKILGCGEA